MAGIDVNDRRVDIKSFLYLRICKEHSDRYEKSCEKFKRCEEMVTDLGKQGVYSIGLEHAMAWNDVEAMEQSHAIVIVFAAMCLESFIYDYAAYNFSDTFVKNYIDKLDLKSKWVLVPQLTTGKKFDTNSKAFGLLVKLVRYRNELVHAKSKPMPITGGAEPPLKTDKTEAKEDKLTMVKNSCEAIKELIKEIEKLDNRSDKPWWWEVMRNGIDGGNCSQFPKRQVSQE